MGVKECDQAGICGPDPHENSLLPTPQSGSRPRDPHTELIFWCGFRDADSAGLPSASARSPSVHLG